MKALVLFSTALCVAVVSFLAFGAADNAGTTAHAATAPAAATGKIHNLVSVASAAGKETMTDFTWKDGNKNVSLSEIGKGKVVFLNFWATWCPPCRREIPDIVEISNEMKNVVVVGVALERGGTDKLSTFIEQNKIPYINIVGDNDLLGKLTQAYGGIQYVPTTFIIANGKIVSTIVGGQNKDSFMREIKKAL